MSDTYGHSDTAADPIQSALMNLEEAMRAGIDQERQRADAAEESLAEARRGCAAAEAQLAEVVSRSQAADERIFAELGQCLDESVRAQRELIAIARKLLHSMGAHRTGPAPLRQSAPSPVAASRPVSPSVQAQRDVPPADRRPGIKAESAARHHPFEWPASIEDVTDEHRIIDRSNRADMERLNSPSRRFVGPTAFMRRNLLAGA